MTMLQSNVLAACMMRNTYANNIIDPAELATATLGVHCQAVCFFGFALCHLHVQLYHIFFVVDISKLSASCRRP